MLHTVSHKRLRQRLIIQPFWQDMQRNQIACLKHSTQINVKLVVCCILWQYIITQLRLRVMYSQWVDEQWLWDIFSDFADFKDCRKERKLLKGRLEKWNQQKHFTADGEKAAETLNCERDTVSVNSSATVSYFGTSVFISVGYLYQNKAKVQGECEANFFYRYFWCSLAIF